MSNIAGPLHLPVVSGTIAGSDLEFIPQTSPVWTALMKATSASMRFEGDGVQDRDIPDDELARFKDVGQKYMELFGVEE